MRRSAKTILIVGLILGTMLHSFADRGLRRKAKNHVILNINTSNTFTNSLSFNLKTGLKYKGFFLNETAPVNNFISVRNSIATYQKGNTIYLIPNKRKLITPEVKQGYTGMKLIIKSRD